ncbi:MAG: glucokinase [Gammaproteobacteria bacterium]|nr:glucokinase [Gammaproteobacteria bacterium]
MTRNPDVAAAGATAAGDSPIARADSKGANAATPVALVVDIGGTNARFGLAIPGKDGRPLLVAIREFITADFGSLAQAALCYLAETAQPPPERIVIAVASVVTGDEIKMTNNVWSFSTQALAGELGVAKVRVINDFAAVGMAIPQLMPHELRPVGPLPLSAVAGAGAGDRHFSVVGPGTGLGVSRLLLHEGRPIVLETEGGHIGFAPQGAYEIAILEFLRRRYSRVSVERLVCGPGLQNLYRAVCAVDGAAETAAAPEQITAAAERGDAACRRAVELFCAILGGFAGDVVLMHGAWNGLYLGGGITVKLLAWICRSEFRDRFEAKGRFSSLMKTIPTLAIINEHAGLLGAAVAALEPTSRSR